MPATTESSDAVRRLVSRAPKPCASAAPQAHDPALTYTLTVTPAENRNWELLAVVGEIPGCDLSHPGPTILSITHSGKWTSSYIQSAGIAGRNCTYVENPEGGFTYSDHTDRLYFEADHEQTVPLQPQQRVSAKLQIEPGEAIEGRATRVATVDIAGPPPVRLRIWFIEERELTAYARAVFARVVGCPDRLGKAGFPSAELLELGVPVRVESYSFAFGNSKDPLVTSTVTNLHRGHAKPSDFQVPRDYHDLRDTKTLSARLGPEGFPSPQTVSLSDIRPGRVKPEDNAPSLQTRDRQDFTPELPGIPACLPATFGAQLAMDCDQLFFDDLRFLINNICARLGSFSGSGGTIDVNWLDQWTNSPKVLGAKDGLFCLMREVPDLSTNPIFPGGHGLLDRLAERQARAALVDGSIGSQVSMPPGLLAQVVSVLAQPDAGRRFDSLPLASQVQLRELYLAQRIGDFKVTYPTSTSPTTTFYDLIGMQLSDIEFAIHIDNQQPMTSLDADNNAIRMHLALPAVRGDASILRWPTGLYFAALAASGVTCLFLPFLCSLTSAIAAVGVFLLSDYAYVRVKIDNFTADATISFQPDAQNVLRPKASLSLGGDVSVWYMSYVPTGIQQLASFVYSLVGSHTDIVIDAIESQMQDSLNSLFTDTLNLSFPPHFGPVPFKGISSSTDGKLDDFLYLQAGIDAGIVGISAPYITQVGPDVEMPLLAGRAKFPAASNADGPSFRPYGGFAISQNLLNYYINSIWRNGAFNYTLSAKEVSQILVILKLLTKLKLDQPVAHIWPAVTPRTVFTPNAQLTQNTYAATFFDDLRLCISDGQRDQRLELQFSAEAFTQIGMGAVDPATRKLDIIRVTDTFLDLYFDLKRLSVKLIHSEVEDIEMQGNAFKGLTLASLPMLEPMMLLALQFALNSRDDSAVPSAPGNPLLQQYAIPGATLDFHLQLGRGNLFAWMGLTGAGQKNGLLALFPGGSFDISTIDCGQGEFLRAFV